MFNFRTLNVMFGSVNRQRYDVMFLMNLFESMFCSEIQPFLIICIPEICLCAIANYICVLFKLFYVIKVYVCTLLMKYCIMLSERYNCK